MAGTSNDYKPDLEAELNHARSFERADPQPQVTAIGGVALYAVETGEISVTDRVDVYMRESIARLGAIGLTTIRNEIAAVNSKKTRVVGNDYAEGIFGADISREGRILGAVAYCAANMEDDPKEDEVAERDRRNRNQELHSIKAEGANLYLKLRAEIPSEELRYDIEAYFEELRLVEINIWKNASVFLASMPVKIETDKHQIDQWIKGAKNRATQLQAAAYQMELLIPSE